MKKELFWRLLEPEHSKAEAFCRKLMQNRDEGDDLYQDSLLLAMRKFDSLRDNDSFRPWLYRIIVNSFKSRHRRSWWRRHATLTPKLMESRTTGDPDGQLTARRWLERAFAGLTPEERTLVTLFELEEWTIAELAGLYRISSGAVKARLFRSRRKMRKELRRYLSRSETTNHTKEGDYALPRGETSVE
jgi:RNA polymerase sigma-70 factor (ECF subfamily)